MANQYISQYQAEVDKAIDHFKSEIAGLRTGRANPSMVETVHVEAYGAKTPLIQLASVSVPEARVLRIEPFDKNIIKDVEKALNEADLGVQATVAGDTIRMVLPPMTEENRKDLVKLLKERLESARISIRSIRDKIKDEVMEAEKKNELTEDDRYKFIDELDKEVKDWNKTLDDLAEAKDKEIMTI